MDESDLTWSLTSVVPAMMREKRQGQRRSLEGEGGWASTELLRQRVPCILHFRLLELVQLAADFQHRAAMERRSLPPLEAPGGPDSRGEQPRAQVSGRLAQHGCTWGLQVPALSTWIVTLTIVCGSHFEKSKCTGSGKVFPIPVE